ncbi:MAG: DUF4159 domain-containing protein [Deltaproteobacteria bacterium]|nr:DUF4159 domain-containing protein [Deltaproteobacteria bacterium]
MSRVSMLLFATAASAILCAGTVWSSSAAALGESSRVEIRGVAIDGLDEPRETARRRLAWEVRKRTSIETRLRPRRARLDDPTLFETPMLYLAGDEAFEPLSEAEVVGLRRFLELGGFLLVDDATGGSSSGFDGSVRRLLQRALPRDPLRPVPSDHTVYRSFYLLDRPVGRVRGPGSLEAIARGDRLAVVLSRHDLGGAWARDDLGTFTHPVVPGGDGQRERAMRLGVNLVMYALCLDYKDDQVHAPYLMRRRGGRP